MSCADGRRSSSPGNARQLRRRVGSRAPDRGARSRIGGCGTRVEVESNLGRLRLSCRVGSMQPPHARRPHSSPSIARNSS
jgi:hypothetical protein